MDRPGELAQANLRPLGDDGDVLHPQRSTALGHDDRVRDVLDVPDQSHFPNIELLETRFDEAAARVGIVVCELLFYLGKTQAIRNQFIWVNADLIFARRATEIDGRLGCGEEVQGGRRDYRWW